MSLILPPFYFADETDTNTGTPSGTAPGKAVTAGASDADGTAVTLLSALGHDVHYLVVGFGGFSASTSDCNALADILTDPAGGTSWGSFIDDLTCGFTPSVSSSSGIMEWYHFPIFIKSGNSLGCRVRNHSATTPAGKVMMFAYGNPSRPDAWWCGSKVESLGITAASSKGTDVTPGASGTYGAWTNIGSTTVARYGAIQMGLNGSSAAASALGYFWQMGYGSNKLPGSPTYSQTFSTSEQAGFGGTIQPVFCDIPAGTQMQARATCSGASPEVINVAMYGVY